MKKILSWVAFCLGCFVVSGIKAYLEERYQPNVWLSGIGAVLGLGLCSHLAEKCPNFVTRTLHWFMDRWT